MRALAILALSTVPALVGLIPGPLAAADQQVNGTVVVVVQDGRPGSSWVDSEFLAVRTTDGLVPLQEGTSAPEGATVTGIVNPANGEFSIRTIRQPQVSTDQLEPRVQSVTVVQAQWANERRVVGDATETARVIEDTVAPYWSNVTEGRLRLIVEQTLSVTIDAPKPKDCNFNSLLDPVEAATGLHGGVGAHLVVVTEKEDCWWAGMAVTPSDVTQAGGEIVLNGFGTNQSVIAHEIGHNFSLKHAGSQSCTDGAGTWVVDSEQCTVDQYGDLNDVMGRYGLGVISPVMLVQLQSLDLLDPAVDDHGNGMALHSLASRWSTSGTRALEVSDGANTYWLEYQPSTPDQDEPYAWCGSGVIVRRVEPSTTYRTYASRLLMPGERARGLLPGAGVTLASNTTHLSVISSDHDTATIAVDRNWPTTVANDVSPPDEFEILLHSQTTPDGLAYDEGGTSLSWTGANDTGSGIVQYQLLIDGEPAPGWTIDANDHGCDGRFRLDLYATPGVHEYAMRATDYAGNTTTSNSVTLLGDETAPVFTEPLSIALRAAPLARKDGRRERYVAPVALHWNVKDDAEGVGLATMGWYWHGNDTAGRTIDVTNDATNAIYRGLSVRNNTHRYGIEAHDLVQNSATQMATIVGRLIPDKRFHADSTWRVVSAKSAVGGERLGSVRRDSRLQITLHQGVYGVVAKTGPNQGNITISVDGAVIDTVDLTAARPNPRQIVWTTPLSGFSGSTLQIATIGRQPVEIDDLIRLTPQ